jgi:hypothetical protein
MRHWIVGGRLMPGAVQLPQQSPVPAGQSVQSASLTHSPSHAPVWAIATPAQLASQLFP